MMVFTSRQTNIRVLADLAYGLRPRRCARVCVCVCIITMSCTLDIVSFVTNCLGYLVERISAVGLPLELYHNKLRFEQLCVSNLASYHHLH